MSKKILQYKKPIIIAALILVIVILIFVVKFILGANQTPAENPNKLVEVSVVKTKKIQQSIRLLGTIHPKHATILIAKGSGTLDALASTGQKIKKGTLIAKIDNVDIEKNMQLSESAELLAKTQYERFAPLIRKGFVSPKEVEEKKQAWIDAQKELSRAKIELDNLRFYAPFDGVIGAYKKREGAQVNQGEAVVSLYDPSSLVVDFDIPCSNLSEVKVGQSVHVLGKNYLLTHVQKMLDEESHMCPADVDIQCENCLIGSTVDIDLIIAEKQKALIVPLQAVFLRNGQPVVYIVTKNKVTLTPVKTGIQQEDSIEIVDGLKPGQQLIIKGQDRLYPGMSVDIYHPPLKTTAIK